MDAVRSIIIAEVEHLLCLPCSVYCYSWSFNGRVRGVTLLLIWDATLFWVMERSGMPQTASTWTKFYGCYNKLMSLWASLLVRCNIHSPIKLVFIPRMYGIYRMKRRYQETEVRTGRIKLLHRWGDKLSYALFAYTSLYQRWLIEHGDNCHRRSDAFDTWYSKQWWHRWLGYNRDRSTALLVRCFYRHLQ